MTRTRPAPADPGAAAPGAASPGRVFRVGGMVCPSCERHVESAALALGAGAAKADFAKGTLTVGMAEDGSPVDERALARALESEGYALLADDAPRGGLAAAAPFLVVAAVLALAFLPGLSALFPALPEVGRDAGLAVLFAAGLATSLHCVAMCGGISLAQSLNSRTLRVRPLRANGLYNLGRLLSYAGIGAAAGALGEVLTPGPQARAAVFLAAGCAMILLGLRLSGLVPALQRIHLRIFGVFGKPGRQPGGSAAGSFAVGLLNGFMPCGPLQAMQLYALSSGGPAEGAAAMLAFGLGTVPAMLLVGVLGGRLDRRHAGRLMRVSALLVAGLGVALLRNGAALAGLSLPGLPASGTAAVTAPGEGTQVVVTDLDWAT